MNLVEYNIYECVRMMKHIILLYFSKYTFERFVKQIVSNYIVLLLLFGVTCYIVPTFPHGCVLCRVNKESVYTLVASLCISIYYLLFHLYLYIWHIYKYSHIGTNYRVRYVQHYKVRQWRIIIKTKRSDRTNKRKHQQ